MAVPRLRSGRLIPPESNIYDYVHVLVSPSPALFAGVRLFPNHQRHAGERTPGREGIKILTMQSINFGLNTMKIWQ